MLGGFVPSVGDSFTILANNGSGAIVGTFAGLAEGAAFVFDGRAMTISYEGGRGNDIVLTATVATIIGTNAADLVDATTTVAGQALPTDGGDSINGEGGNDNLSGLDGDDTILGGDGERHPLRRQRRRPDQGAGRAPTRSRAATATMKSKAATASDTLAGDDGDDTISGDNGRDYLSGGDGDDKLEGGRGKDTLQGGAGDDTLIGDAGKNVLTGGDGNDTFVFKTLKAFDKITDYAEGEIIRLDKDAFHGIGPKGVLKAQPLPPRRRGGDEETEDPLRRGQRLAALRAEGLDTADPEKFAKIGKGLDIDHTDFLVI